MGVASEKTEFLTGGGFMGALMRDRDWSRSPLGDPEHWSSSLKTTVGLLLRAEAQIVLFWGHEFVALYNDAYAPTIGDKHPRALGRPACENWIELWDDLEPLLEGVRDTGKTFSARDRPFYIQRHGFGETVYFDISYSAVPEADGRVGGVLCIVSETTERVRASAALRESEARLRELNENLEQRIGERTRELEQAHHALRQAQKMEAVGQLTGGIAHDFNNLLQGITGNLDLIRRRPDDLDRVGRWADAGLKAAERGARLAGQLLAFSRTQKMEITSIDISSAVSGFADVLRRSIGPAIRIHMDLRTDGLHVQGDQIQLEMAVLNLALNARDAMPDGGDLVIATRTCRFHDDLQVPDGDYVELSVTDSGKGMSADVVERAFEPFFTTKEVGKGTGLGLSQVYGTLRQSGGAARIESTPGHGTIVRLYLRRTDALSRKLDKQAALDKGRRRDHSCRRRRPRCPRLPDGVARQSGIRRRHGRRWRCGAENARTNLPSSDDPRLRDARNEPRRGGQKNQGAAARPADHLRQRLFGDGGDKLGDERPFTRAAQAVQGA